MSKITICLLCGGQSTEHQVSLLSAKNVLAALSQELYDVLLVGISQDGAWNYYADKQFLVNAEDPSAVALAKGGVAVSPCRINGKFVLVSMDGKAIPFDVMFPVLHGTNGEDGAVQGLAQLLGCPCVGCRMLASAICMDKDVAKQLLEYNGIKTAPWMTVLKSDSMPVAADVVAKLGLPLFVKPANAGSSVGVVKVKKAEELAAALQEAMKYDEKVLIESAIAGREIECAVLGNHELFCAFPGEVVPKVDFYSYDAKYTMDDGAELKAPAELTPEEMATVQGLAKKAFKVLGCRGFTRVDFFLKQDGTFILNELNTIPGFTKISMYPRLMGLSGISYPELVDRLVQLALE